MYGRKIILGIEMLIVRVDRIDNYSVDFRNFVQKAIIVREKLKLYKQVKNIVPFYICII